MIAAEELGRNMKVIKQECHIFVAKDKWAEWLLRTHCVPGKKESLLELAQGYQHTLSVDICMRMPGMLLGPEPGLV